MRIEIPCFKSASVQVFSSVHCMTFVLLLSSELQQLPVCLLWMMELEDHDCGVSSTGMLNGN
jgi:hypothetical protein